MASYEETMFMFCFRRKIENGAFTRSKSFKETEEFLLSTLTPESRADIRVWKMIYDRQDSEGVTFNFLLAFFYFARKYIITEDFSALLHWVFHTKASTLPDVRSFFPC